MQDVAQGLYELVRRMATYAFHRKLFEYILAVTPELLSNLIPQFISWQNILLLYHHNMSLGQAYKFLYQIGSSQYCSQLRSVLVPRDKCHILIIYKC